MSALNSAKAYYKLAILTIGDHRVIAIISVVVRVGVAVIIHFPHVVRVVRVRGPKPPPNAGYSDILCIYLH